MFKATTLVAAGVAVLDEYFPGWYGKINGDDLVMASMDQCILGQLFGDYLHGLDRLESIGINTSPWLLGFSYYSGWYGYGMGEIFEVDSDELTNEWRKVIKERKGVN